MPELVKLHRLCQCLVRCGFGRFVCAAQDVAHFVKCIEAGGDYVRDISITGEEQKGAGQWVPEAQQWPKRQDPQAIAGAMPLPPRRVRGECHEFNESECGGVFDGNQVTSDADPGL